MGVKLEKRYNNIRVKVVMANPLNEIKKKIDESKNGEELIDLDLTEIKFDRFTPEICALIEKEKNLEVLIIAGCGLKSLAHFPKCKFQAIDISNNDLNDDSNLQVLASFPDLTQIFAGNNQVKQMSTIMKLKDLKRLIEIDFEGNPVAEHTDYSKEVFENFIAIQYVDRKDKEGNVIEEEGEEGEFEDDEDEEDYEEDDEEDFSEDEDFEEESQDKPVKGKKKK